jgi:phenylacetate-coenzyme A ligase PaaK-like adenylate-forming protein
LRVIVAYVRAHSTYFADRYRDVPDDLSDATQLPVVTKAEMMRNFDQWVTDPSVHRDDVVVFTIDPTRIGRDYLDRYVVCTTSGSTGTPALVLHDQQALTVYNVLGYVRSLPTAFMSLPNIWALIRGRGRLAAVFVTGGHFLGNTMMARRLRTAPWRAGMQRLFSALSPLAGLVGNLNGFQPVVLGGYPSVLESLATEQQAGRLRIHPVLISAAGETLTAAARQHIAEAFGCRVTNYYGSSEAVGLTFECSARRLHVNTDWYIVEPVDEHHQPVRPGQLSHDVLVTNLANRIQPIIRYPLGDRVAIGAESCSCGSPFPTIEVVGRTDDILLYRGPQGESIRILPLAIATVAEQTPGVTTCQLIQQGPSSLTVRFTATSPGEEPEVWGALRKRLGTYLAEQGASDVIIEKAAEPPQLHQKSGKFRQVYVDYPV